MKIKYQVISAALLLLMGGIGFTSCENDGGFDYDHQALYLTGTESNPMVKFVVEDTPATYAVTVQATAKVPSDVELTLAIDPAKVEEYNAQNHTAFFPIPEDAVELENPQVTIKAGNAISSAASVKVVSTENFVEGATYVIPVTIAKAAGSLTDVIAGSQTIYLRISRIINFASIVANYSASSNFIFDNPIPLTNFTYEMKICPTGLRDGNGPARFTAWEQADESKAMLLRFNEVAPKKGELQVMTAAGTLVSNTQFQNNRWYHIAVVWDGTNLSFYVDGVLDNQMAGKDPGGINFQRYEMGMSWGGGYPASQFFAHRFCEFRLWSRALTASEITGGLCGVAANSDGLEAYWKFNEGEGHIFHDATGHGFDMDWSLTSRDKSENGVMVPTPEAANAIQWVKDDLNKCAN